MNIKEFKEIFNEEREIVGSISNQNGIEIGEMYFDGEILLTNTNEIIVFIHRESILFDEEELVKYIELAEEIYDKYETHISVFVLADNSRVTMDECNIPSDANFTIKLCVREDPVSTVLLDIKERFNRGEKISDDEIQLIEALPMFVPKSMKKEVRIKCLKLLNEIR